MTKQQAEKWLLFLRSYGPVAKNCNMYAEEMAELSRRYEIPALKFQHPVEEEFLQLLVPSRSDLTNVVLTGTAGDGKTTLCYALWEQLGGDISEIKNSPYKVIEVQTPDGPRTVHFLFDLSGWAPEGQPWREEQLGLLDRFATSVGGSGSDFFVIAANDGKLIQIWRGLAEHQPSSPAANLRPVLDDLLAQNKHAMPGNRLVLLNLSRTSGAKLLQLAMTSLFKRSEWDCFESLSEDPAFGKESPLRKNWLLLKDELFAARLSALLELCDANGLHVPIREIYLLLVNTLLGHPRVGQHVMKASDLRQIVSNKTGSLAAAHRNLFGENLSQQKRDGYRVFGYLSMFRVGEETSNEIDNLILFGRETPELRPTFDRLIASDPHYGANAAFERLRQDYLNADEFGEDQREQFLGELSNERRRLFFRIPDGIDERIKPWHLTVFQSAGKYREQILSPLTSGQPVELHVVESVVKGLNRAWSGMLVDDGTHLHLTSGLDFTTARLSPIALHRVPVARNYYGEEISIERGENDRPKLIVRLLKQSVGYELNLLRFEFLERISLGSLPNSFSRECYEDVIAFKSRVLAAWQATNTSGTPQLRIMDLDDHGSPREYTINL